jgi:uncharacterized phage protein gp47/JayE
MSTSAPSPAAVLDPTIDFVGLFADQTEDVILNRMISWANEGLDPVNDADLWTDTREGSHWYTAIVPAVREIARLYDLAGTEVPMSAFILWAWGAYLDDLAAAYSVERVAATAAIGQLQFTGPAGTQITLNTTASTDPTGPNDDTPDFATTQAGTIADAGSGTGTLTLSIQATAPGAAGDVAANAITVPSTPLPAGVTLNNALPTGGGADAESDESLRLRVLQAIVGQGGANVAKYVQWASQWPGVGQVKVVPTPTGPNSVLVMIDDANGQPLPADTVAGLQQALDPFPGKGSGLAPVGAQVDVETSTPLSIDVVVGSISYESGYSADGAGGTIAVGDDIKAGIAAYMQSVRPGTEAVLAHVAGIIATWPGVHDAGGVTLNAGTTNIAVSLSPPQSPFLNSLTFP